MIGLAFDENFNQDIVRGMLRRNAGLDGVRLQDTGLSGQDDPTVLEWAAQEGRVLISHDVSTITPTLTREWRQARRCRVFLKCRARLRLPPPSKIYS